METYTDLGCRFASRGICLSGVVYSEAICFLRWHPIFPCKSVEEQSGRVDTQQPSPGYLLPVESSAVTGFSSCLSILKPFVSLFRCMGIRVSLFYKTRSDCLHHSTIFLVFILWTCLYTCSYFLLSTTYDIGVSVYELVSCWWADELAHEVFPYCVHAFVCLCFSMTRMIFQMFTLIQPIIAAVLMVILDVLSFTTVYKFACFPIGWHYADLKK